ncbi:membrane protein [Caballeronia pedi]|uniref:Membrane protein n=1 Tax=Caballeronia pedi TaxID=1777141 RepID=A0A158DEV4_9BURK|nr:methyl-accepting chemotaxis protein [Caballeronia pedi]SAK92950.1 membrane protein [Caballeronia pedi]
MNHFLHTIRFRMMLAFGIAVALMLTLGLFGLYGMSKQSDNMQASYSGNTVPISQLAGVRANVLNTRRVLWMIQATQEAQQTSKVRDALSAIENAWSSYYPNGVSSDDERAIAENIETQLKQFRAAVQEEQALIEKGDFQASAAFQRNTLASLGDRLTDLISQDVQLNVDQAKNFAAESAAMNGQLMWVLGLIVSVGVVIAIGTSVYLSKAIATPLGQSVQVANAIAAGDLRRAIAFDSHNEFRPLLDAMKRMSDQLTTTVRGILSSSEAVSISAREIAGGNIDLSARTEEQASSLEETAASMTQIAQTVRQNADNARHANTLATSTRETANSSNSAVQTMVEIIGNIRDSSTRISEITTIIESIAFQTNILALNAAVEAARAGEQGRGFAVVASEVRALAQRSSAAAKEIKDLIESSATLVRNGVEQAEVVGAAMTQVIRGIQQVSEIVGEISEASEEQSQGIEQVHQAISQIDSVTQQNAALVEQSAAAAQSLEQSAVQMTNAVAVFELSNALDRPARRSTPHAATTSFGGVETV